MGIWDYVLTAPTNVTHSCVGNFTAPNELNLIVAKCTRIEIHLLSSQGLQLMLDMPIYGRIAILELFRPHGETQDHLIMVKEAYQFSVLQWDAENAEFITRAMADVSYQIGIPAENRKIGIVDPDCRLIGLHLYDGIFKVIPFDNKGKFMEAFDIRFEELRVLDIKFLYGCPRPTIVVLYQDAEDVRHMKTYEVALKDECFAEGPWSQNSLDNGAELLIPVPPPLCGVLIIGEETIVYCSASAFKAIGIRRSITKAYGRVDADGSRYLLGDHKGLLHLLVITHDREKVTGLKIELLGKTCIASSISYLDNDVVFVCSSYGDSQMIKLNLPADAKGSHVEVLKRILPKSVHGWGPGVFKGWSPNMAFLSAIPNQVGNFAKFTTKSLSAYFSSWNFYPGPAASAAPGDIISWSSNLSLPGPAAPGDTVSSSSNLSLPGPASASSGNTRPSRMSTLDLSLWLDEMNELMLMVQHLRNGSRYYSVIYTKFSVFKPVLKDNFSSLSSLLVAQNCAPEPDYHALTGCKAWMLMSSCGKSPEMDDAVFLWNPINDEIKTLPPFCSQPPFPSPIGSRIQLYGMGVDPASGCNKVVRTRAFKFGDESRRKVQAELLSLETGVWKEIPYPHDSLMPTYQQPCRHINGICYWVAEDAASGRLALLSFNFANEKFSPDLIPMPDSNKINNVCTVALGDLCGSLAVIAFGHKLNSSGIGAVEKYKAFRFEIWVWKDGSWSNEGTHAIPADVDAVVVGLVGVRKLLLMDSKGGLLLYDLRTRKLIILEIRDANQAVDLFPLF